VEHVTFLVAPRAAGIFESARFSRQLKNRFVLVEQVASGTNFSIATPLSSSSREHFNKPASLRAVLGSIIIDCRLTAAFA